VAHAQHGRSLRSSTQPGWLSQIHVPGYNNHSDPNIYRTRDGHLPRVSKTEICLPVFLAESDCSKKPRLVWIERILTLTQEIMSSVKCLGTLISEREIGGSKCLFAYQAILGRMWCWRSAINLSNLHRCMEKVLPEPFLFIESQSYY
jgi:hypothetical protein